MRTTRSVLLISWLLYIWTSGHGWTVTSAHATPEECAHSLRLITQWPARCAPVGALSFTRKDIEDWGTDISGGNPEAGAVDPRTGSNAGASGAKEDER